MLNRLPKVAIVALAAILLDCQTAPKSTPAPPHVAPVDLIENRPNTLLDSLVNSVNQSQSTHLEIKRNGTPWDVQEVRQLFTRIDSTAPCLSVVLEGRDVNPGLSTEGEQAAYLIAGFRHKQYPPTISSDHLSSGVNELRLWWEAVRRDGLDCDWDATGTTIIKNEDARAAFETDIADATFRYLFDDNISYAQQEAETYFLSIPDQPDLINTLIPRFANNSPPVKPEQELRAILDARPKSQEFDNIPGLLFSIYRFDWLADSHVHVEAAYYEGSLSSSTSTFCVKRHIETWLVMCDRIKYIS